jgi:flavorubredoxin
VIDLARLRWVSFGHVEADECGAMNRWLAAAPHAQVVFNPLGCMVSLNDLADRTPRAMTEEETLDLGGHRIRLIPTPHVPHGWEAQVLHDETTGILGSRPRAGAAASTGAVLAPPGNPGG